MGAILAFETIGFRHGTEAETLSNISFELARGQIAIVSGAAGSGKSALAGLAALALRPSRGRLRMFDVECGEARPALRRMLRRRIGFIGDGLPLLPQLSVRENVALPLAILGVSERETDQRIGELLDWMALTDRADAHPEALSHGERDRVAIARAVVGRPELVVADEPLSSPDAQEAARVCALFERLAELGSAVLVTARMTGWAAGLTARRLRIEQGQLL